MPYRGPARWICVGMLWPKMNSTPWRLSARTIESAVVCWRRLSNLIPVMLYPADSGPRKRAGRGKRSNDVLGDTRDVVVVVVVRERRAPRYGPDREHCAVVRGLVEHHLRPDLRPCGAAVE